MNLSGDLLSHVLIREWALWRASDVVSWDALALQDSHALEHSENSILSSLVCGKITLQLLDHRVIIRGSARRFDIKVDSDKQE